MNVTTVLTLLSSSRQTDEELAISLVKLTRGLSGKSLEDAFAIALGVGKLNDQTAQNLISIFEKPGSLHDSEKDNLLAKPEFAAITEEIEQLLGRQQQLFNKQQFIFELQASIVKLQSKCEEAKLKKSRLNDELEEIQEQLDRLGRIESELQ